MSWLSVRRVRVAGIAGIAGVVIAYAYLAWQRRWMSDDGLIFVRTARQILEGNGPVFNVFERAESSTSTLWTYLLAGLGALTRRNIAYVAVYTGLVLATVSVALGMITSARLHRERSTWLVPGSVVVILAVFPFWDFATSGLETGLAFAWMATCWWLLVTLSPSRLVVSAIVFGLGPLVRPDLGVVSLVMFAAAWLLERPPWKRALVLVMIGGALPVAYQIFRAGYYGTLVPLPALAKSASNAEWERGLGYLRDFDHPYMLWIPFATLVALGAFVVARYRSTRRERIVVAAPLVCGVLMLLYVLRVGGDFMHGRMLLPAAFMLLLPTFMLPIARTTAPVLAVLAIWAVRTLAVTADGQSHATVPPVGDERVGYARWTWHRNPIDAKVFVNVERHTAAYGRAALAEGRRIVVLGDQRDFPLAPKINVPIAYLGGRLGTAGAMAPLDAGVIDILGLANPLGARITPTAPGYTGHEKSLPMAWVLADYGDPDAMLPHVPLVHVRAARRAMQCGELAELLASVREPLTLSRFWANLTGSLRRTRLVIPSDPILAEHELCGDKAESTIVLSSSSYELEGWAASAVADGVRETTERSKGWAAMGTPVPSVQWVQIELRKPRRVSKVVLYPASGAFPIDFAIEIWDGSRWVERVTQASYPAPTTPQTFSWEPGDVTSRVRIIGTRLVLASDGQFRMQLAEVEIGE